MPDSQSNGEKAAPGPIESVLRSSPHLSDALVVGTDRPHLGLLLFRSPASAATPDVLDLVRPLVAQANQSSPSFAQISLDMCLVVDNSGKALPKSSKGTIQRGLAYEVFREETERLYETVSSDQDGNEKRDLPEIESRIKGIIVELMGARRNGDSLGRTTDLFSWGVDSLMATRVRTAIQRVSH